MAEVRYENVVLEKILDLADTIIDETKKDKFIVKEFELDELTGLIINKWQQQYNWVKFIIKIEPEEKIKISFSKDEEFEL